jgi:hypothetical protein
MHHKFLKSMLLCGGLAAVILFASQMNAQQLTLEGQTGGFITPTAYVVPSANDHSFSLPAVGFHFVDASSVIGNVETISVTEGFGNRFEFGYTSSLHQAGNSAMFSALWSKQDFAAYSSGYPSSTISGMNVFHGKVVVVKENTKHFYTPGFAVGGVYRQGDHYVSGSLSDAVLGKANQTYGNGDIYGAVTKTWAKPPVPVLLNFGVKGTNAVVFGLGGVAESWSARPFGGIGIPLPLGKSVVAVPSAGFASEPSNIKNLDELLATYGAALDYYDGTTAYANNRPHIPTTLDYAVRFTQRKDAHFSVDIGVGQLANNIGTIAVPNPAAGVSCSPSPSCPVLFAVPISLDARHVFGFGISFRP